jgi:septum formation protein
MRVVLASGSPRRRELLSQLGVTFDVRAPDIDESIRSGEGAVDYVRRLAAEKAMAVDVAADELVVAADTTVELDGEVLGKPADGADAAQMLTRLSGRTHAVHTGVAVRAGSRWVADVSSSMVTFVTLSPTQIEWYVATGEAFDKAGGYALQGAGGVFVRRVEGSVSGIIGLPLDVTVALAGTLGVDLVG